MKKIVLMMAALMMAVATFAQRTVKGKVIEQDTQEEVIQATAALLKGEKVVANAVTNTSGTFSINLNGGSTTYTKRLFYGESQIQVTAVLHQSVATLFCLPILLHLHMGTVETALLNKNTRV